MSRDPFSSLVCQPEGLLMSTIALGPNLNFRPVLKDELTIYYQFTKYNNVAFEIYE